MASTFANVIRIFRKTSFFELRFFMNKRAKLIYLKYDTEILHLVNCFKTALNQFQE